MSDKLIGESIGQRYRILEKIGSGGLGTVYKVLDTRLQRLVALKVLHFSRNAEAKELFLREVGVLARLKPHPNIVQIYEAGETETLVYLVFEYIEGRTLSQILKDARPAGRNARAYALQDTAARYRFARIVARPKSPGSTRPSLWRR